MVKILLVVMVKNEERILERCINSAYPIIDGVCIVDTGSTDNTVKVAEEWFATHPEKLGRVFQSPFINFGESRTNAFAIAKTYAIDLDWDLETTFALLLDADHKLKLTTTVDKLHETLKKCDCIYLYQLDGQYRYYNVRLIRMALDWKCNGVTHEVWKCKTANEFTVVQTGIWIDDIADGGCKADKFERDKRLLLQGLVDDPNNIRYVFYLAQTYACMEEYEKSVQYYENYTRNETQSELTWFSQFMVGKLYLLSLNDEKQGIQNLIDAYEHRKTRAEPFYTLACYYAALCDWENAKKYTNLGKVIPFPETDYVYIDEYVYRVGFDLLELQFMIKESNRNKDIIDKYNAIHKLAVCDKKFVLGPSALWEIKTRLNAQWEIPLLFEKIPDYISIAQRDANTFYLLMGSMLLIVDSEMFELDRFVLDLGDRILPQIFCHSQGLYYTCLTDGKPEYGRITSLCDATLLSDATLRNDATFEPLSNPESITYFSDSIFINNFNDSTSAVVNKVSCGLVGVRGYLLTHLIFYGKVLYFIVKCNDKGVPVAHTTPFMFENEDGICNGFAGYGDHDFIFIYNVEKRFRFAIVNLDTIEEMMIKIE